VADIPWWAWIGVGLFVAIASAVSGGALSLFAWVGLIFIAIGIGKIVYLFVIKPRESKEEEAAVQMPTAPAVQQYETPKVTHCPQCKVTIQPTDHFCRYCGTQLR